MVIRGIAFLTLLIAVALIPFASAEAGSVKLSWMPSASAQGYRVYFGSTSRDYMSFADVGPATQAQVDELDDCQSWFFAVTAYNSVGESGYSNEVVTWTRPRLDSVSPGSAMQGSQITLTLTGGSFPGDAELSVDRAGLMLDTPSVSCHEISVVANLEPTSGSVRPAEVGMVTLTITRPDGRETRFTDFFEVLIDPARFDINQSDSQTDGRLDGKDTVWLSRRFKACTVPGSASKPCDTDDPLYDPSCDFNGDGWVDGDEIAYLAGDFGRCWNGSAWTLAACPR